MIGICSAEELLTAVRGLLSQPAIAREARRLSARLKDQVKNTAITWRVRVPYPNDTKCPPPMFTIVRSSESSSILLFSVHK